MGAFKEIIGGIEYRHLCDTCGCGEQDSYGGFLCIYCDSEWEPSVIHSPLVIRQDQYPHKVCRNYWKKEASHA